MKTGEKRHVGFPDGTFAPYLITRLIMQNFIKYPRTPHLCGSRLQPGDAEAGQIDIATLSGGLQIWEEKIDGANAAISFPDGCLMLQSRGHPLNGGARENQFSLFKAWASCHEYQLRSILGQRYIMFGEWCYAKHTVFYDVLPHYFLEFDIYDREQKLFLSTKARHMLLRGSVVVSVPVLHEGKLMTERQIRNLLRSLLYKSGDWRKNLFHASTTAGVPIELAEQQTDMSLLAEGLYLKHEDERQVLARYKYVRADFLQTILDSGSHWAERPLIANRLRDDVDIYGAG